MEGFLKNFAYDPELHGYSKREIRDTVRRTEQLIKDLDVLVLRKKAEIGRLEGKKAFSLCIDPDENQRRIDEAQDHIEQAEVDAVALEMELPFIKDAIEKAPDETPPLQHLDYHQRCENIQNRRGAYWRDNEPLLNISSWTQRGARGLGRPTPEQDRYWPTHQVPWEQGAPSPPPLTSNPPTPPLPTPHRTSPPQPPPSEVMCTPSNPQPTFSHQSYSPSTPSSCFEFSLSPPSVHSYKSSTDEFEHEVKNLQYLEKLIDEANEVFDEMDAISAQITMPTESTSTSVESPGLLTEEAMFEAFSPEKLGVDEMNAMMDDATRRHYSPGTLDPAQIELDAFSPEVIDDNALQAMLRCQPSPPNPLLTTEAVEGLRLMGCEPRGEWKSLTRHGYGREQQWNARVEGWRKQKRMDDEAGETARARQRDAESIFGVRSRDVCAPGAAGGHTPLHYQPETLAWGESPVDRITPPPTHAPVEVGKGKGKRLVKRPKRMPYRPDYSRYPTSHTPACREKYEDKLISEGNVQRSIPSSSQVEYDLQPEHLSMCIPEDQTDQVIPEGSESFPEYGFQPEDLSVYIPEDQTNQVIPEGSESFPEYGSQPEDLSVYIPEESYEELPEECDSLPEHGPEIEELSVYIPESVEESPKTLKQKIAEAIERLVVKLKKVKRRLQPELLSYYPQSSWIQAEYANPQEARGAKQKEQERLSEVESRKKWDTYMLCRYGSIPTTNRFGKMRIGRSASTYRPRPPPSPPPKKKTPAIKPYDSPLYGPWRPWVFGSDRPPPRTAAGRISSPCESAPRPALRTPLVTPPQPCPSRVCTPRSQPAQVRYGSVRPPPKTASSYKYAETPKGRPLAAKRTARPRRILPPTPGSGTCPGL